MTTQAHTQTQKQQKEAQNRRLAVDACLRVRMAAFG